MRAPIAAGHSVVHVGYGRLEAGGWYLIRHPTGRYDLRQVGAPPGRALVAIRSIRVSPFPEEEDKPSISPATTRTRRRYTIRPGSSAPRPR